MSEEDFRSRILAELLEEEPPPMSGLVAAALDEGLRRRRRRRLAQVLASAAGITAFSVAAATAARPGSGSGGLPAAAGPTPTIVLTASTSPHTTPTTPMTYRFQPAPAWMTGSAASAPADGVPPTARALAAVLIADLGELGGGPAAHAADISETTDSSGQTIDAGIEYGGSVFWNKTSVALVVRPPGANTLLDCESAAGADACSQYELPDSTLVGYVHFPAHPDGTAAKNTKAEASIFIVRPDGTQVSVIASDGREQEAGPDRADLPLTERQLWSIAADPRIGTLMDPGFVATANKMVMLDAAPY